MNRDNSLSLSLLSLTSVCEFLQVRKVGGGMHRPLYTVLHNYYSRWTQPPSRFDCLDP